ncbi:hypothetical protein LAUMK191_02351 [Mycobacterium attenuatum]|uniref:Uncharacterized protein n=1 Tax=Mycobacterium attenuatum TaxID=2341086 RepID=A0A498Q1P6_9MYCO|nr:hypothetical protein LAUMK136_02350 [Mycobacterium attenuatum]VBA52040.1 hypothetical protein LAUMK191_02351 [Mycobacterium attenuatum]VBA57389.1 hypothetical protein LAUMK41_02435 [Mycobacterium attenuatum]
MLLGPLSGPSRVGQESGTSRLPRTVAARSDGLGLPGRKRGVDGIRDAWNS